MSADIVIIAKTQRIIVDAPSRSVTMVMAGPQGPVGQVSSGQLAAAVSDLQDQIDALDSRVTALE